MPALLDKERTVAGSAYNRWLVVPSALCIHLCIGMAYGFSVFWLPMTKLIPNAAACADLGFIAALTTTTCNWSVPVETHVFETFIAILGISAAIWGGWLEHAGPRKAGFVAALCWGGGMALGGIGVATHQLWLFYLGTGVIGGVGQGLGYITPVSTLIKWFPDRRGMATGFAIMGYGGGAMVGAPLAVWLMKFHAHDGIQGVSQAMITMGAIYFIVMSIGAFSFRVAPAGWLPEGWKPPATAAQAMITAGNVHLRTVAKTPQFWLIWLVLCLNVTAGIGVIAMASPMLQDVFGASLLGANGANLSPEAQKAAIVAAAAGLVGLISLFNAVGRLFWASLSDRIGRKTTYAIFFVLGMIVYGLLPTWGHMQLPGLFVLSICLILTMYGGGFSTIPAYLADIFGTQMVGAIHGRLITAWTVAGIAGPMIIASVRQFQLDSGVAKTLVYDNTLYLMAALLFVGLICNLLVRPVDPKHYMSEAEQNAERALQHDQSTPESARSAARGPFGAVGVIFWLAAGVTFLIGVWIAVLKAAALF
jgi:MFS family permease